MGVPFASGRNAFGFCDRCGFRCAYGELKELVIKTKNVNIRVCNECWEQDHPQLQLGMWANQAVDPQALRDPRPDLSYYANTGDGGSRVIQWGWNPVGGARGDDNGLTPNDLVATGYVGTVTVTTS